METLNIKKKKQKSSWAQNMKLGLQSGAETLEFSIDRYNLPVWQFLWCPPTTVNPQLELWTPSLVEHMWHLSWTCTNSPQPKCVELAH